MPNYNEIIDSQSEAVRPDQAIAPTKEREGATAWSGYQPSSKFSNQGSASDEMDVTKQQRKA